MRQIWHQLSLILLVVLLFSLSACDDDSTQECQAMFQVIGNISKFHVNAAPGISQPALQQAILHFLAHHEILIGSTITVNSSLKDSPQDQCVAAITAVKEKDPPRVPSDLMLELLSLYVHEWDPHSMALGVESLLEDNPLQTGYGFSMDRFADQGPLEIVDVVAGSPAHIAGLKEGMLIFKINEQDVHTISNTDLLHLIQNKTMEKLTLDIKEEPDTSIDPTIDPTTAVTHRFVLESGIFTAAPLKWATYSTPEGQIGYIKLRTFEDAKATLAETLRSMQNSISLILDLRNISGGKILDARDIANLFIPNIPTNNAFVGFWGRDQKIESTIRLHDDTDAEESNIWHGPLVVLVDDTTKSAAEILAGALQDYGALIVGTPTFGKGTRQDYYSIRDFISADFADKDGAVLGTILLTDAYVIRPSGKPIQEVGVAPDISVSVGSRHPRESNYPGFLPNPIPLAKNQHPLVGFNPAAVGWINSTFQSDLQQFNKTLQEDLSTNPTTTPDDLELATARKAALFFYEEVQTQDGL